MIRIVLCLCLSILSCSRALSQAPPWQWAKDANSPGPEQAWDISCDKATGNVYVAGSFNGNLSAFYGSSLSSTAGQSDGFVAKYSAAGAVLWAFKIGGSDMEEVKSVVTDPYGNIYITGYFKSTTDFDPSAASYTLAPTGGNGSQDGFLAKYSSAGALLWAVKFGDAQADEGFRVFADSNFVYITGDYTSSATFYSTNAVTKSTAAGQQQFNAFGAKYSAAGVVQWVVSAGSVKDDIGYNIIADNNNVYMIGTNQHDMTVYDATGTSTAALQINNPNKSDVFILAYQQSGAFLWASNVASNDDDFGSGLTQDAGNIYVSGSIKNTASFPYPSPAFTKTCQGGLDIFLAKLSKSNGVFQWVSSQTGSGNNNEVGYELDMGLNNSIVMSGYFDNNLNYSAYGGPVLNTSGNEDIFVSTFDNAGNFKWAVKAGANGKDEPYGLSTDTIGDIYIAGEHAQNTVFGSITITSGGGPNIFAAKMGCYPVSNNTATASQTICAGSTPASLNGSSPAGGSSPYIYTWQQSSNGSSWSNAVGTYTSQNYAPPALGSSMYYRRIAASSNGCGLSSTSSTLQIDVDAQPTTASAGADQSICATGSTLNANSATTGSGLWTVIAGTGTVAAASSPTTAVGNLSPGINKFVWSISNGVCPVSRDTVVISWDAMPTAANAGTSHTLCAQSYTLSANTPAVGSASWSVLLGSSTIVNSNSPASVVNNLSPGANAFVWTISNGICPASKDTVVITRDVTPSPALAGSDQAVCGPATAFNANTPSVGTGAWALISGSGTVTFPASSSSPVTGLGAGTNVFTWTISNGSCLPSSDTVRVISSAIPSTAIAGPDQGLCAPNGSLTANTPSVGTGIWTVVSGTGIIANPGLANTIVLGLSAGNNVFAWAISNGICPVSSDTLVIRRDLQPTAAAAGSDQAICAYTTTLDGNTPLTGTGSWSLISGSGSFANSAAPQAQVTGLAPGNALLAWTISNGVCPSSQDTVTIHVDASPGTADAGSDQAVCSTAAVLSANPPPAGNGAWSLLSGSGSIANLNAANSAVNGLTIGTSVFRWTVSNGVCPSSYDDVSVRRDTMPSQAQAGPDQDLGIPAGHLSAVAPVIGNGSWSLVSGAGSIDNPQDPATAFHDLAVGSNIFRWTVSNGACPASKDEVNIYLEPFRIPNAFSPNGDQVNDLFVVPGVDYYNGVKFTIFNRWGGVVYENDNYKNDWGGTNKNNELLAEDTYYYVLDVGPKMSYSGYVIIKRNK